MDNSQDPQLDNMTDEQVITNAPSWYHHWRNRIHTWVTNNSRTLIADIVLFVPDMLMLTVNLIKDKRVPLLVKAQLVLSAAYVISPVDFIPEGLTHVIGLVDDATVLALTLYWLQSIVNIDSQILKDNWVGESDPNAMINDTHKLINDNASTLFSSTTWQKLQSRFDKSEQSLHQQLRNKLRSKSPQLGKRKEPIEIE